jgi:hypothetical protein
LQGCLARLIPGNIGDGELIMALQQSRLPARFPVGTHYIVEGEPAKGGKLRIVSRYLVMPSGERYDLMSTPEPARKLDLARKSRPRAIQRRAG